MEGTEDTTVPEATGHLDAGHDEALEFEQLEHLSEHAEDPALRRELADSVASGQARTHRLRSAWDRLLLVFQFGR